MSHKLPMIVVIIMVLSLTLRADDANVPAELATPQKECTAAIHKAEADFIRAQIAAKQKYLVAIDVALKNATRAAKLDEANAINEQKTSVETDITDLKELLATGGSPLTPKDPASVTIDARQGWQTVLHLKKGQIVHLKAAGTWHTYGPDEFACDAEGLHGNRETNFMTTIAPPGALLGKFGETVFVVGKAARFQAPDDGDLQVRINKKDSFLHDDSGQLTVAIRRGDAGPVDKTERRVK